MSREVRFQQGIVRFFVDNLTRLAKKFNRFGGMMQILKYGCLCLILCQSARSQVLNAYAKITGITGSTQLNVSNVNQASHTFTVGGKVIIMQMQDDVIGANTADVASFGDLSSISSAGLYEIGTIASRSPATGTPTTITLSSALANTYHTGTNSSLQLISFRNMGASYTNTATITGLAWDGNIGGVVAFEVTNTLTLNFPVSADVIGFRRGLINSNAVAGACLPNLYRSSSNSEAFKGEGIYKSTDVNYTNARGKILNGGGGGNEHNGGGGGGGNYSAGGNGGMGYSCGTGSASGGLGGISLNGQIASNRIFMGGGGGGGQQNNTVGLDGGNGGGIILIKATTLATSTSCGSAIRISANGGSTASCGNDGAGGGGAAGTIVLQINNYSATSTCPLTINSNGGNGGNVGDGAEHGGGGGGGQGAVIFSSAQPTVNVTTTTTNGLGGKNNSAGASYAGNGGGVNNTGILSMGGPLPVELLYFTGYADLPHVKLNWVTASEKAVSVFIIERSADGLQFSPIGRQKALGSTRYNTSYTFKDESPLNGVNYYRLKQQDMDGKYRYSATVSVLLEQSADFKLFPNPQMEGRKLYLTVSRALPANAEVTVYDMIGKVVHVQSCVANAGEPMEINASLGRGVYLVSVSAGETSFCQKLVIH